MKRGIAPGLCIILPLTCTLLTDVSVLSHIINTKRKLAVNAIIPITITGFFFNDIKFQIWLIVIRYHSSDLVLLSFCIRATHLLLPSILIPHASQGVFPSNPIEVAKSPCSGRKTVSLMSQMASLSS